MTRDRYVTLLQDLLSNDADRIMRANRALYGTIVANGHKATNREADLALAEAGLARSVRTPG